MTLHAYSYYTSRRNILNVASNGGAEEDRVLQEPFFIYLNTASGVGDRSLLLAKSLNSDPY